ncbi:MAG: hypothetical protein WB789_08455 [Thermoplasmata archaeon]
MQQLGGLRGFVQRPVGRTALLAFAILVTFATYVYLSTLLAIPVILLVGLAVPIWLGIKRLRTLAMFGLVILLLVAPLATVLITQDVRTPIPPVSSPSLTWSNGSIAFSSYAGTYAYRVSPVANYSTDSSNGTVSVSGANRTVSVVFTPDRVQYSVMFTESGLQAGTSWSVTFGGVTKSSTTATVMFLESNGTYAYSVPDTVGNTATPNLGTLRVDGAGVGEAITFSPTPSATYSVTFSETGLTTGTSWSVTVGNVTLSSTTVQIVFTETNRSYSYGTGNVRGYLPHPASGTVAVAGADVKLPITFAPVSTGTSSVTFFESGLPIGVSWNVTFNGTTQKGSTVGTSGSVMQNASVSPYLGSASTNFTWSVTINTSEIPGANSSPLWLNLYISTCPGATSPSNDPNCNAGYPFWLLNYTFPGNLTAPTVISFHFTLNSDSIWAWQMGLYLRNLSAPAGTNQSFTYVLLSGDPVYNGLEGPVTGDYGSTYSQLVLTVYLNDLIYLGIPYFVVLLVYSYITRRKSTRADMAARAAGGTPTDAPGGSGAPPPKLDTPGTQLRQPPPAPRRPETNCSNCGAVVYANETTCWKCGTAIASPSTDVPLSSGPPKGS